MASIIDDPSDRTKRNRFHKKKKETNKDRLFEVGWANCGDSSPASMQKRARRWPRSKLRRRKKKNSAPLFISTSSAKKKNALGICLGPSAGSFQSECCAHSAERSHQRNETQKQRENKQKRNAGRGDAGNGARRRDAEGAAN